MYSSLKDGGVVDRIGLKAWRDRRRRQSLGGLLSAHKPGGVRASRPPPCLVHIIERSSPFSGADNPAATGEADVHVVRSPKSGVNFFDLGNFEQQFDAARRRARPLLEQLVIAPTAPAGSKYGASAASAAGSASSVSAAAASSSSRGGPVQAGMPGTALPGSSRGPLVVVARQAGAAGRISSSGASGGGGGGSDVGSSGRKV